MNEPAPPDPGGLDPHLVAAVVDARYRREVGDAAEAARRRAQAGWVIVSAVAVALIAAGALTDLEQEPSGVRILGIAALVGWIATAGLFMWAVAGRLDPIDPSQIEGTETFVQHVLDQAKDERERIDRRAYFGWAGAAVALLLTVITTVILQFTEPAPQMKSASVTFDSGTRASLARLCGKDIPAVIRGLINVDTSGDGTLEIELPSGICGSAPMETAVTESKTRYVFAK